MRWSGLEQRMDFGKAQADRERYLQQWVRYAGGIFKAQCLALRAFAA
jgi:hypothetical protein